MIMMDKTKEVEKLINDIGIESLLNALASILKEKMSKEEELLMYPYQYQEVKKHVESIIFYDGLSSLLRMVADIYQTISDSATEVKGDFNDFSAKTYYRDLAKFIYNFAEQAAKRHN